MDAPVQRLREPRRGFSMVEMMVVIAIISILLVAGVSLLSGTGAQARKADTDTMLALIEQARTTAITSRSYVALVIAEPGALPADDERCRIGLFRVAEWPSASSGATSLDEGVLLSRWKPLNTGIVLLGGEVDGFRNPLDHPKLTLRYGTNTVTANVIAFNPRGGLHHPAGSDAMILRIAEGTYRGGSPTPITRGNDRTIAENQLRIGRVIARPYRIDG